MIYLAADHRGYTLKEVLQKRLTAEGHIVEDVGAFGFVPDDDYVDFAEEAAKKVNADPHHNRAILICGSGHGMDIVANKYGHVRAALGFNRDVAIQSRAHEDANVLVLPSDWLKEEEAASIVTAWLSAPFSGEDRHLRRIEKIKGIEMKHFKSHEEQKK